MIQPHRKIMFNWPWSRLHNSDLPGISSAKALKALIEVERARVDRYGHEFSLVIFKLDKKKESPGVEIARVLSNRARSIDKAGWLNGSDIAVLLPDTPAQGARKFAEDVCAAVNASAAPPAFKIFTYPSHWFHGESENPNQRANAGSAKNPRKDHAHHSTIFIEGLAPLLGYDIPAWKRLIDKVGAFFGLIFLFPLFLLITIVIKIVSPGPAFFKQQRIGHLGRPFSCLKFRTMQINADSSIHMQHIHQLFNDDKPLVKLDDSDTRIIPFGKLLRNTGLDELPQLINVLRGEMSLVGPRPDVPYSVQNYKQWHLKRFDANPGLSGLWQTSHKTARTFNEMTRLDITYTRRTSFWLDAKILLKTFSTVIRQMANGA